MTRKRFDSSPQFNVKEEGVLIQQVAGSSTNLLEVKSHSGATLMAVDYAGTMTSGASNTFTYLAATTSASLPTNTTIGAVSPTELGYLDGVTSAIQTQLNSKLSTAVTSLTGTANQITVSASTGSVTLSLPQNIHTGAAPTFAGVTSTGNVTVPTTSAVYFGSANGSNFWRPIDEYNNSYFRIATGSFYADAANYYFRNASSVNNLTIDSSGNTSVRGNFNGATGGADGGLSLRPWTAAGQYQSLATTNMGGSEYMVLSDGTDTFVSGGSGGGSHIRGGANSTSYQLYVGPSDMYFSGIVRKISQPAVYAFNTVSYTLGDNQRIAFNSAPINRGNHYNASISLFTCPVAGMYFVHAQILTQYNGSQSDLRIAVNGNRIDAYSGYSLVNGALSSHKQGHVQGIVSANANDNISIMTTGGLDLYGSPSAGHTSLVIHFLG